MKSEDETSREESISSDSVLSEDGIKDIEQHSCSSQEKMLYPAESMRKTITSEERILMIIDQFEGRRQQQNIERTAIEEWERISQITDRFCFMFFLVIVLSVTVSIVAFAPHARAFFGG